MLSRAAKPSLTDHVDEILRLGTVGLIGFWHGDPDRYTRLSVPEKAELAGLVYRYYETLPKTAKETYVYDLSPTVGRLTSIAKTGKRTVVEIYNATVSILKRDKIEPTDWAPEKGEASRGANPVLRLERFWALASAMGAGSLWVLIDGVDEAPNVSTGTDIFNAIADLLLSLPVMEFRQDERQVICVKVFLTRPDEVRPLLREAKFREDRVKLEEIRWLRGDMNNALTKRLAHFSANRVLGFDQLCVPNAEGTHDRLLDEAELRPRTLFRMAHEIFAAFQRRSGPSECLIDKQSTEDGIRAGKAAVFG